MSLTNRPKGQYRGRVRERTSEERLQAENPEYH